MKNCPQCGFDVAKYEAEESLKRAEKRKSLDQEFDLFYKSNKFSKSDFWKTARLSIPLAIFLALGIFFLIEKAEGHTTDTFWYVFFSIYLILGLVFGFQTAEKKVGNKKCQRHRKFFVERGEGCLLRDEEIWW